MTSRDDYLTSRDDYLKLRSLAKEKPEGLLGTFVYVLLSHMRGKLHMQWYGKYAGGWRKDYAALARELDATEDISKEDRGRLHAAYTGYTLEQSFAMTAITCLKGQKEWLQKEVEKYEMYSKRTSDKPWYRPWFNEELIELATRVLAGYTEEVEVDGVPVTGESHAVQRSRTAESLPEGLDI